MHAFLTAWVLVTVALTGLLVAVIVVQRLAGLVRRVFTRARVSTRARVIVLDPAPFEPSSTPELTRTA